MSPSGSAGREAGRQAGRQAVEPFLVISTVNKDCSSTAEHCEGNGQVVSRVQDLTDQDDGMSRMTHRPWLAVPRQHNIEHHEPDVWAVVQCKDKLLLISDTSAQHLCGHIPLTPWLSLCHVV